MRSMKGQIEDWAEGQGYDVEIISHTLARLPDEVDPWSGTVDIRVSWKLGEGVHWRRVEAVFRAARFVEVREKVVVV